MSDTEEIERHHAPLSAYSPEEMRYSMRAAIVAWIFGAAFSALASGAVLTAFLTKYLRTTDIQFGLILAAGPAAALFVFFGSHAVEMTGRTKPKMIVYMSLHRMLWLGVAGVALIWRDHPTGLAIFWVGIVFFVSTVVANYGGAGISVWLADIVPKGQAGRYFSARSSIGMISMTAASLIGSKIVEGRESDYRVYVGIFAVAAILGTSDIFCWFRIPEYPRPIDKATTLWDIFKIPWGNSLFRHVSLYCFLAWFAYSLLNSFIYPFFYDKVEAHGLGLGIQATNFYLNILPLVTMILITPLWGQAIDRFGSKPVMGIGSLSAAVLPIGWLFVHRGGGFPVQIGSLSFQADMLMLIPVIQVISCLLWPAVDQGVFFVQIRGFPELKRSAYMASFGVVISFASMLGSILGGHLATFWKHHMDLLPWFPNWSHYHPVFLASIIIRLAAFFFLFLPLKLEGDAQYHHVAKSVATEATTVVPKMVKSVRERRNKK
jgi:MFS family permease